MVHKKRKISLVILIITTRMIFAQPGSITNISATQRTDGSMIVDIYYDLAGTSPQYIITTEASFNGGTNFSILTQLTGDTGAGITTGPGKHITWNFGAEFPGSYSTATKIRIRAYLNDCFYITDIRDGQEYSTVQLGEHCWMAENANYASIFSICFDNSEENCNTYGRLYTIDGAETFACPPGWILPSDEIWCEMTQFVDNYVDCINVGPDGLDIGPKLRSPSFGGGSNTSGFTALGGGWAYPNGVSIYIGEKASFWTSTTYGGAFRFDRTLEHNNDRIIRWVEDPTYYKSVRCIRD